MAGERPSPIETLRANFALRMNNPQGFLTEARSLVGERLAALAAARGSRVMQASVPDETLEQLKRRSTAVRGFIRDDQSNHDDPVSEWHIFVGHSADNQPTVNLGRYAPDRINVIVMDYPDPDNDPGNYADALLALTAAAERLFQP